MPVAPSRSTAGLVILSGSAAGAIVIANGLDAVPPAVSATWIVKLNVPAAVGVPVIVPAAGSRLSPAGKDPDVTDQR